MAALEDFVDPRMKCEVKKRTCPAAVGGAFCKFFAESKRFYQDGSVEKVERTLTNRYIREMEHHGDCSLVEQADALEAAESACYEFAAAPRASLS